MSILNKYEIYNKNTWLDVGEIWLTIYEKTKLFKI